MQNKREIIDRRVFMHIINTSLHTQRRAGILFLLLVCLCLPSCHYSPLDLYQVKHGVECDSAFYSNKPYYMLHANLEAIEDSVVLACLPIKDCYDTLFRADRVVVAEFAIHSTDSIDTLWVKLAHSQDVQGWMRLADMKRMFVPVDSISQFIYLFSQAHIISFILIVALFIAVWMFRMSRRKQLRVVCFNDIDSLYPLLLCLLVAFSAMIYESIQVFAPETWEQFYYSPTLSPWGVPFILSLLLCSIWLFVVVLLAALEDVFRQLPVGGALFYLLGLITGCIFCYFFFILTTHIYVGYLFFAFFCLPFFKKAYLSLVTYRYRCGHCGRKLKGKGKCPECGALNY